MGGGILSPDQVGSSHIMASEWLKTLQNALYLNTVHRDNLFYFDSDRNTQYTPLLKWPITKNFDLRTGILHIVRDP